MKNFKAFLAESEDHLGFAPHDVVKHYETHGINKPLAHTDSVDKTATHHLMPNTKHLTKAHRGAIIDWAGDNSKIGRYKEINNHLRKGHEIDPHLEKSIHHLSSAVKAKPLTHDVHVYRGLHAPMSDDVNKLKPGDTYHDKGFVSTSLNPHRASYFAKDHSRGAFMHVHMKKGQHGMYMGHPDVAPFPEHEMLLHHGSRFTYKGHTEYKTPDGNVAKLHHFDYAGHDD